MKRFRFAHSKSILMQWILTSIIILFIPFISILINYSISKKIISSQVKNSSDIILSRMQNAIDSKLQGIRNLSYRLLLDDKFIQLSQAQDRQDFLSQSQICYEELKNYHYAYPDINILIYYPNQDYIVTSGASCPSSFIYNSMNYASPKTMLPYEEWLSLIGSDFTKSSYFFSDYCNYNNTRTASAVFGCTSPFIQKKEAAYNILVSAPIDFISNDLADLPDRTFFICKENGDIVRQFGKNIESLKTLPDFDTNASTQKLNGTDYYCSYTKSAASGWFYVLCAPRAFYLQDSIFVRNVTLASTIFSLLIGIALIFYIQYRNYRPVKEIMEIIPVSMKSEETNEFQQIELYHSEMQRLNLFMQKKLNHISQNVRELYFYSKLKGVSFHIHGNDIMDTINLNFSDKHFVIISLYPDINSFPQNDIMRNWQLLQFAINNVSEEVLLEQFPHESIQDEFFQVFFFILDQKQTEEWNRSGISLFQKIFEFFRSQFQIELFITVSPVFENFEQTSAFYSDILTTFESNYAQKQVGIQPASQTTGSQPGSDTQFNEYSKAINLAIFQHDYAKAASAVHRYIGYLQQYNCSKVIVRYNIYSLIATILMDSRDYINQATRDTVESYLSTSFNCSTLEEYETHIGRLLHYLCEQSSSPSDTLPDKEQLLVKKIKNYVENYYSDYSLNVTAVADAVNLSPNYMSKIFKNNTNEGLLSYINYVRINHAKELLRTTNINIDEIALMVGFSNSRSFRRNFQNLTGITATDYRNGSS
ncbi:MAG: helix-turn-helix transcriptional regulator [Lachnospiraceae bacterium]|nr:helix-turn-helix transcriptional regulator [Lachnospiraceae bacterium]